MGKYGIRGRGRRETMNSPTIFALFRFSGTLDFCYPSNGFWPFLISGSQKIEKSPKTSRGGKKLRVPRFLRRRKWIVINNVFPKKPETRFSWFRKRNHPKRDLFCFKYSISCGNLTFCDFDPQRSSRNDSVYIVLAHVRFLMILFRNIRIPQGINWCINSMSRPGDSRFAEPSRNVTFFYFEM